MISYLMPAFLAFGTDHGPVMKNGALPAVNRPSALSSPTLVERIFSLPSLARTSAPLIDSGLLTMTLLAS